MDRTVRGEARGGIEDGGADGRREKILLLWKPPASVLSQHDSGHQAPHESKDCSPFKPSPARPLAPSCVPSSWKPRPRVQSDVESVSVLSCHVLHIASTAAAYPTPTTSNRYPTVVRASIGHPTSQPRSITG